MRILSIGDQLDDAALAAGSAADPVDVEVAARLDEGLARIAARRFDLVVLDLKLPDSAGPDTMVAVRAAAPDVPIVVITTDADEDAALAAVRAGAEDYVVNGRDDVTALRRAVTYALARQHARRGQAAGAGANAGLDAESERRRAEAEALAAVARSVGETLEVPTIGTRVADSIRSLFQAASVVVWLGELDGSLRGVAASGVAAAWIRDGYRLAAGVGLTARAVAEGRTMTAEDIRESAATTVDAALGARVAAAGYRGVAAVPLRVKGASLGAITVALTRRHVFTASEIAFLESFADQAALALANARLFEQSERRRREAEELAGVARSLTQVLDPILLGHRMVERVMPLFEADSGTLWLLDPDGSLRVVAVAGSDASALELGDRLGPGTGVSGRAVVTGRTTACDDVRAFGDLGDPTLARMIDTAGNRSVLATPLSVEGGIVGVLAIGCAVGRRFSAQDVTLLEAFAGHAGLALANARLYAEAEHGRRVAEVMAQLARSVGASLDLDTVLARIAEGARELCRADLARICLRDEPDGVMRYRHCRGTRYDGDDRERVEAGIGCGGRVMITGEPFRTVDRAAEPRIVRSEFPPVEIEGIVSQLVVPIKLDDRVEGLIDVANRAERPFSDADEDVLVRLADHAALAIRNAASFAREQDARRSAEVSEVRYRQLVNEVPVCLFRTTPEGRFLAVNAAMVRVFGYPDTETLLATPVAQLYVEREDRLRWRALIDAEGAVRDFEVRGRRFAGSTIWIRHTAHALRDAETGAVVAYEGAAEDVTARRRAEEALVATEAQVRQLQKLDAFGRLAGGIAHDFNNLLTVICARSQLVLNRAAGGDERLRRDVGLIRTTGERAAKLTKQLLAFSRKQVLEPRVLDANEVITALTPMLRRLIPEHIEFLIAPGRHIGRIRADAAQLEQVIVNLVLNARDAMPDGGRLTMETMEVHLDGGYAGRHVGVEPGPYVVIAIIDTGAGMTAEVQAQAFEPFFTTKERGGGTGLGLSTVYGIVKQSGGHVSIQSEVGLGSTFKVHLPRVAGPAERVDDELPAPEPVRGSETVLLVEDELDVRTIAREILEGAGYRVLEAGHAEDALHVAQRHDGPIHALITDVVMPRSSGPLLAARLIRERAELRVVYMSGYSDGAVVGDLVVDSGTPFVQKPFTPDTLLRKLREALDRKR